MSNKDLYMNVHSSLIHWNLKLELAQLVRKDKEKCICIEQDITYTNSATWMSLSIIMLNGRSQTKKGTCCIILDKILENAD